MTSQIFANIYLNEFDQFVLHSLKPQTYVRYGDDFVLWCKDEPAAREFQIVGTQFLVDQLGMDVNLKHDRVQPAHAKLAYLGVDLWPSGRRLQMRTKQRISKRIELKNVASYQTLIQHHQPRRYSRQFIWKILDIID